MKKLILAFGLILLLGIPLVSAEVVLPAGLELYPTGDYTHYIIAVDMNSTSTVYVRHTYIEGLNGSIFKVDSEAPTYIYIYKFDPYNVEFNFTLKTDFHFQNITFYISNLPKYYKVAIYKDDTLWKVIYTNDTGWLVFSDNELSEHNYYITSAGLFVAPTGYGLEQFLGFIAIGLVVAITLALAFIVYQKWRGKV